MKLRYEFTMMDMGGEIAAVPTGDNAAEFHGVLKLNDVAKDILEQLFLQKKSLLVLNME